MERKLFVLIQAGSQDELDQVLLNLSDDKPVLEDEVEPQWRPMFLALEFILPAEDVHAVSGHRALLGWPLRSEAAPARYLCALAGAGLQVLGALEAYEDGGFCRLSPSFTESESWGIGECSEEQVFFSPGRVLKILSP